VRCVATRLVLAVLQEGRRDMKQSTLRPGMVVRCDGTYCLGNPDRRPGGPQFSKKIPGVEDPGHTPRKLGFDPRPPKRTIIRSIGCRDPKCSYCGGPLRPI